VRDVATGGALWLSGRWLPVYAVGARAARGCVRVRLQLNSNQSGVLAAYGYALPSIALRCHAGDVVLFTPNNASSFVIKARRAIAYVHC
jgi:hypothetical protein